MAGNVKGITIEFRGETTKLSSALKTIDKETRSLDKELRGINNALKFNPTSVDLWRQKQTVLKDKIKETQDKLKLLKDEQARMDAEGVDKNSKEYRELQREIITAESKLKHFEAQLKQVGNAKLKALGEQFKQVGEKIKKVGAKMTELGQNLTMKVTAPLAAVGGVAVKSFAEVDKTMQLTNATMGNTEQQAQLLSDAMKEAAANSTFGMTDAATATLNFARAGLTAEQAASALAPAMNLAAGEGGNLDTVSAGLVATINGFGDSFNNASTYADVFSNACNNSALDIDSLSNAMSVAAPIFSAAGFSVQDAALYMGTMANAGIEASVAANALKTGMARLVKPAKEGDMWLKYLGVDITNADGSMKDSLTIQKELHDSFSKLSESEQIAAASAIFGKNQMSNWLALINTAPSEVGALNTSLSEAGTTAQMAESMMGGFGGSLEKLSSSIDVAKTSFGEALAPMVQKVTDLIQKLVDWFNGLDSETQTLIATIAVVVAAVGPVLMILGMLISTVGTVISGIGSFISILGMLAGPVGIVIAIIAALIAVGVLLYKNWDKIKAFAIKTWNAIKTAVTTAVTNLKNNISNIFNAIKANVVSIWNAIKTTISNVWNAIKTKVSSTVNGIKNTVITVFNAVKSAVSTTWNKIKESITKPIEKAKDIVKSAIDKIKSIVNNAHLSLPHFKLPHFKIGKGTLPWGIGGKGTPPSISVDWYAKGGIFDGASLIGVGEKGPEAVIPLDKLWTKMDKIAEGSGMNVVINVQASPGMDTKALAEEVQRQLINTVNRRRLAWQ